MECCRGQATMVRRGHWKSRWRVGLLITLLKH